MDIFLFWLSRLMDPLALAAWGLVVVLFLIRGKTADRRGYLVVLALLLACFAFATPLGANILVGFLEHNHRGADVCAAVPERAPVVVLSGGVTGPPYPAEMLTTMKMETYRRVVEGVQLARSRPGAVLILSGGGRETLKEADVMAALAVAMNFPQERIIKETLSTSTFQNGLAVASILQERGMHEIRLVTSSMHMPRAAAVFRKQGLSVCPVPVDVRFIQTSLVDALIPRIGALQNSADALHELAGYIWYYAAGRL